MLFKYIKQPCIMFYYPNLNFIYYILYVYALGFRLTPDRIRWLEYDSQIFIFYTLLSFFVATSALQKFLDWVGIKTFMYLLVCAFRGKRPIQSTKYQVWVFCENSFFGICMGLSPLNAPHIVMGWTWPYRELSRSQLPMAPLQRACLRLFFANLSTTAR